MATSRPLSSVTSASTNAVLEPPEITWEVQVKVPPGETGARKLTFISALAEYTFRPWAHVMEAAPMAESHRAATKPPWRTPTGLVKRSSAGICHTVRPGCDLSVHTIPKVRSQLGGTCTRGSATPVTVADGTTVTVMVGESSTVVRASTVFALDGPLSPGEVVVDAGIISAVRGATGPVPPRVLAPGFIDLQINGIGESDVAHATDDDWARLDQAVLAQGTTTWCPALVSAPLDDLVMALEGVARAAARPPAHRPAIAGAHLEGPFLSLPGAHRPEHVVSPVDARWLASLPDALAVVTLAPEIPGALDAIAALAAAGIVVSLGHSACTAEEAWAAADNGATLVTHVGNAMGPSHQRRPGLLGAALADDRLSVSVIADLVHLHRAWIEVAFAAKGPGRVALVTDSIIEDDSRRPDGHRTTGDGPPTLPDGTLAGTRLTMNAAIRNCSTAAHIALGTAITAASTTPARLLGLHDRGAIAPGRRADLVALDDDLNVQEVWVAGTSSWAGR